MFLHNSFYLGSFRRNARNVLATVFFVSLLFIGCKENVPEVKNTEFIPLGEWSDNYGSGYTITGTTAEYYTEASYWEGITYPAINLKGTIESAVDFSHNAGVLLIRITSNTETHPAPGKYTCIYYRDYTSSHVYLANPADASYNPLEADTLNAAKNLFTVDNVNTHVTYWGTGYTK